MSWSKLIAIYESLGLLDGSLYLFARLLERASAGKVRTYRYNLVAQPVAMPQRTRRTSRPDAVVRQIFEADKSVAHFPRPPDVIAARFADGHTCFAALGEDGLRGFLWLARDLYDEDEVRCRFELHAPQRSAWDFDVYVAPRYRMGRTFSLLWDAANAYLAERNVEWVFSRISAFRPASLRAHSRLGAKRLYSMTFFVAGKAQLTVLRRPPYIHLSLSAQNRPVVRLVPPA